MKGMEEEGKEGEEGKSNVSISGEIVFLVKFIHLFLPNLCPPHPSPTFLLSK